MTVKFYNTSSPREQVNKTLNNATEITDFWIKDVTNILNPTIFVGGQNARSFNYCYLPDFDRYYFAKNKGATEANTIEYELSVDVLMSYQQQIRQIPAIIEIQENNYNLYLDDVKVPEKRYKRVQTYSFPINHFIANHSFVLGTVGK